VKAAADITVLDIMGDPAEAGAVQLSEPPIDLLGARGVDVERALS